MARQILTVVVILSLVYPALAISVSQAPTVFKKLDFYIQDGEEVQDHDAQLVLDAGRRRIVFSEEGNSSEIFAVVDWDRITGVSYENSKHARITAGLLVAWPMLFLKGRKHWLTITFGPGEDDSPGGYVFARMDKDNFQAILAAVNGFTGQEIRRIEENGEISVLYPGTTPPRSQTPAEPTTDVVRIEPLPATAAGRSDGVVAAGALPPMAPTVTAPVLVSKSASWTRRTAEGVGYEWNLVVRNDNDGFMRAIASVVLRDSTGKEIHIATGQADVAANSTHMLSGNGTVGNGAAAIADHWTLDVDWAPEGVGDPDGTLAVAEDPHLVATVEPSPSSVAVTDSDPTQSPDPSAGAIDVRLSIDLVAEQARITNTGRTNIDLRGWELVSVTDDQRMKFVIGLLPPGSSIVVTSGRRARNTPGYYLWTTRTIWDVNGDPAELYDPEGVLRAATNADGSPR